MRELFILTLVLSVISACSNPSTTQTRSPTTAENPGELVKAIRPEPSSVDRSKWNQKYIERYYSKLTMNDLCRIATRLENGNLYWDTRYRMSDYLDEAFKRGYTLSSCEHARGAALKIWL